ncbi:hypothetical protein ACVFYP_17700 [Roseomonas sp. F4]
MRVYWTLGAQDDAKALVAALASRSAKAAGRLAEDLALSAERLADFPHLGISAGGNDRYLLIAGGRYRLSDRVTVGGVRIHGISRGTDPWPARAG